MLFVLFFVHGRKGEFRCVTRRDLIEILAEALPAGTMRFGCHVVGVQTDTLTCHHILRLADGSIIRSKVMMDVVNFFRFSTFIPTPQPFALFIQDFPVPTFVLSQCTFTFSNMCVVSSLPLDQGFPAKDLYG